MSYDINFWKQGRTLEVSPQEIYERLNRRQPVEGLVKLPVGEILTRLKSAFPDFDPTGEFPVADTAEGSVEFIWSDYHFRFDLRGICGDCQKLVDIMGEFGCPMYDPQVGKRYDAQNGTAVGEVPKFEDETPEQKAKAAQLMKELMAKLNAKRKNG